MCIFNAVADVAKKMHTKPPDDFDQEVKGSPKLDGHGYQMVLQKLNVIKARHKGKVFLGVGRAAFQLLEYNEHTSGALIDSYLNLHLSVLSGMPFGFHPRQTVINVNCLVIECKSWPPTSHLTDCA